LHQAHDLAGLLELARGPLDEDLRPAAGDGDTQHHRPAIAQPLAGDLGGGEAADDGGAVVVDELVGVHGHSSATRLGHVGQVTLSFTRMGLAALTTAAPAWNWCSRHCTRGMSPMTGQST